MGDFLKGDVKVAEKTSKGEGMGERLLLICKNILVVSHQDR